MAKKRAAVSEVSNVPCVRVIAGDQWSRGAIGKDGACVVVKSKATSAGPAVRREIGFTSKTVDFVEGRKCGVIAKGKNKGKPKNCPKPCAGFGKRKGCPVQLAFDRGQPFLRFCVEKNKPGLRLDVKSPAEAMRVSKEACGHWERHGNFTGFAPFATAQLKGPGRRR